MVPVLSVRQHLVPTVFLFLQACMTMRALCSFSDKVLLPGGFFPSHNFLSAFGQAAYVQVAGLQPVLF